MQFYLLAPGARFEFRGEQFKKTAISMAQDSERMGHVFQGEAEITPIGEPLLLSEAEAEKWKPSDIPWNSYLTPSPVRSAPKVTVTRTLGARGSRCAKSPVTRHPH